MKFYYLLFFLLLISCSNGNKTYICGESNCSNKKDAKNYFEKNLSVEVELKKKADKSVDLVKLNTSNSATKKTKKQKIKQSYLNSIKEKKSIKKKIKKEKEAAIRTRAIEEKKLNNTKNEEEKKKEILKTKTSIVKKNSSGNNNKFYKNKNLQEKRVVNKSKNNFCSDIENCDIDKITELLNLGGKDKDFPNISN